MSGEQCKSAVYADGTTDSKVWAVQQAENEKQVLLAAWAQNWPTVKQTVIDTLNDIISEADAAATLL